ncbi:allantoate amidohydrolase [Labrys okinawensis]|uniref:Allantoate amidohydrolase n=1 Tax=Labrys okinawensis TaxID=346911 RepID=A0A2S9QGI9_9HYPH|nr:allantoate amidohydrolase [Labrys okinawensis]PRH88454.1 allantoate amidohydrolase [Labrys okinawensis]
MRLALATSATSGGARAMARLDELAACSAEEGALTRLYLTPEHAAAIALVKGWMEEAGMSTELDAAATLVGRYPGATPDAPVLILGSHIDTVRNAGRYDGNLGVIVAIEAVAALHQAGERLPFAIEVTAFGDEEGVRFPVTLTGSRSLAGTFQPDNLDATDKAGISLREALVQFGCDPDAVSRLGRDPARTLGYVEVHIEQGPVLEAEDLPVGIVTAINGASRFKVDLTGKAGHAGTVPMGLRLDAGAAAAEMILATELITTTSGDLVATVGACEFRPGAVNVIPGSAHFSIDIRSPDDAIRNAAVAELIARFETIAARRGVTFAIHKTYDEPAARCDPRLIETFEAAVAAVGLKPLKLSSGAGHDGLAMISLCPIAMLFLRCKGGVSHNPAEAVLTEDVGAALEVLLGFLKRLPAP